MCKEGEIRGCEDTEDKPSRASAPEEGTRPLPGDDLVLVEEEVQCRLKTFKCFLWGYENHWMDCWRGLPLKPASIHFINFQ